MSLSCWKQSNRVRQRLPRNFYRSFMTNCESWQPVGWPRNRRDRHRRIPLPRCVCQAGRWRAAAAVVVARAFLWSGGRGDTPNSRREFRAVKLRFLRGSRSNRRHRLLGSPLQLRTATGLSPGRGCTGTSQRSSPSIRNDDRRATDFSSRPAFLPAGGSIRTWPCWPRWRR